MVVLPAVVVAVRGRKGRHERIVVIARPHGGVLGGDGVLRRRDDADVVVAEGPQRRGRRGGQRRRGVSTSQQR